MKYRTCISDRSEMTEDSSEYWTIEGYPKGLTERECSEIVKKANNYEKLESETEVLQMKKKKLKKILESIENVAPGMYRYNKVELEMIRLVRKVISEI